MASAASPPPTASSTPPVRSRRVPDPARRRLFLAVALVGLGSFLPWIYTPIGTLTGARGPGLWTFYAAMLGLAGAVLPVAWRRVAGVQAAIMAMVAVGIPVWQVVHLVGLVGFGGWFPGPGLVLVFFGGVLAALAGKAFVTAAAPS